MFLGAEEKRGLSQEKRGSPGAKAALQISLHRTEEKPLTRPTAILEEPQAPVVEQPQLLE